MKIELQDCDQNKGNLLAKILHVIVLISLAYNKAKVKGILFKILKEFLEEFLNLIRKNRQYKEIVLEALIDNEFIKQNFSEQIHSEMIAKLNKNVDTQKNNFVQNLKFLFDESDGESPDRN